MGNRLRYAKFQEDLFSRIKLKKNPNNPKLMEIVGVLISVSVCCFNVYSDKYRTLSLEIETKKFERK